MVATTHKGSLACAAAAALAGQGQVAPRGCGTHGLDGLGLSGLRCPGAFCGLMWAAVGLLGVETAKSRHHHHSSLNAQRSTGFADSRSRNVAQRRGEWENRTGGWGKGYGGVRKGWECNRREKKKIRSAGRATVSGFLLLAKFLLAFQCIAGSRCSAAARTSGEVRWPGPWRSVRSPQPTRDGQMRGWGREAARVGRQVSVLGPLGVKLRQTGQRRGGAGQAERQQLKPDSTERETFWHLRALVGRVSQSDCAEPRWGWRLAVGGGIGETNGPLLAW